MQHQLEESLVLEPLQLLEVRKILILMMMFAIDVINITGVAVGVIVIVAMVTGAVL